MALVLTREYGERVQIGGEILVTVVKGRWKKDQVKLLIQAPRTVRVMRYELLRPDERAPFAPVAVER